MWVLYMFLMIILGPSSIIFMLCSSDTSENQQIDRDSQGFVTAKERKNRGEYIVTIALTTGRILTLTGLENYNKVNVGTYVWIREEYHYDKCYQLLDKKTYFC